MTAQLDLFNHAPRVRVGDPATSADAAEIAAPGNEELIRRIRQYVWQYGPVTAFDVANYIVSTFSGRWQSDTVRSAVSRAGLSVWPHADGLTPGGRRCRLYHLATLETRAL